MQKTGKMIIAVQRNELDKNKDCAVLLVRPFAKNKSHLSTFFMLYNDSGFDLTP